MLEIDTQEVSTKGSEGFTLIELLLAMTIFSFMLLIIIMGFMNIVRLHNESLASNQAQDSARTAMDELVLAVRDSGGVLMAQPGLLCLANTSGQPRQYYLVGGILSRADGCGGPKVNPHQVTSDTIAVSNFEPVLESTGTAKSQVRLTLTVGTANNSTTGTGANLKCGPSQEDRTFCSVVTLTSRAVQR